MPVRLTADWEGLYGKVFTCRPDSPRWLVRFQESRAYAKAGPPVQPDRCEERRRGSITMDNCLYGRYSGEVQLIRQDLPADEKVNVIGHIQPGYELLMDCIRRGSRFCMIKEDTREL